MVPSAALLLATLVAFGADSPEQRLDWDAVAGCPSQPAVVEATGRYLGRPLSDYPRSVVASARVEAQFGGFELALRLTLDGRTEEHTLSGVDCEQLGRDVALLIASAVDPFMLGPPPTASRQLISPAPVVQRPGARRPAVQASPRLPARLVPALPRTAPPPVVALELPADARPPGPDRPTRARRSQPPITGTLGLAGVGFVGLFPRVGGGLQIDGGLERGLLRWELGASGWFAGSFRAPGSDVGADLRAATASTAWCVNPGLRRVQFAACAVVGVGAIAATSVNTVTAQTHSRPWAFAGPRLRFTYAPIDRLGLVVAVAVIPALARPAWSIREPDVVFRVPAVAGVVQLGLELRQLGSKPR